MACTLYVKGFFSRVYCAEESLKESSQGQDKAVTCKGEDKDFAPSCPRDLLCDHWAVLCVPLNAHCLISALNARSLVTGLTSWSTNRYEHHSQGSPYVESGWTMGSSTVNSNNKTLVTPQVRLRATRF